MSGSIGADVVTGGSTSDQAGIATVEAIQTSGTHAGTPAGPFGFFWLGSMLSFQTGVPFIATPDLYAALNASTTASELITWGD
jgi:hypothetical protein